MRESLFIIFFQFVCHSSNSLGVTLGSTFFRPVPLLTWTAPSIDLALSILALFFSCKCCCCWSSRRSRDLFFGKDSVVLLLLQLLSLENTFKWPAAVVDAAIPLLCFKLVSVSFNGDLIIIFVGETIFFFLF
ncbi:hypothetical protein NG271_310 [Saccharomyces cerevisiae synthetic construct]|uniref:Putative uncharacterized protein YDR053W n=2 Tax=Saccharomyces cerevisiae TaxID=4932 RepID=YD053_YEAST|nr:RecName: Full=Putative uncharacterized protein YDR053W; Flags: Precursor [Saccharomyces cerevisiae S288C]AAT93280.1 YDR053W [Saccharomyces cerevisiae]EWG87109.1 hypothetical protein R008_D12056 [Saccharomyces cerevisiae R008]EWG91805.1 hypothetical protein P301_D12066 [Saccharomyces cerevisiae P301]EWG97029.1 hypothetical protein R103_D22026 [Saccharomyces cerevisiae R103]WNF19867.1 hypothetical protein NG271_310 [Saccharomyces cerevisiae synthetic construct]CAY78561.1 EC1118_1D0_2982p [Sa